MPGHRRIHRVAYLLIPAVAGLVGLACNIAITPLGGDVAPVAAKPDGIDPADPAVERSTRVLEFGDVATLRIDLPTGRVVVEQSGDAASASLKVTETVLLKNQPRDQLKKWLNGSQVTAERSFVDATRLEIGAEIAGGLTGEQIAFDLHLVIPRGVPMQIVLGAGPVEVTGVQANVEISTRKGAIGVKGVTGRVVARTEERDITVADTSGSVEATTRGGDISLRVVLPGDGSILARTADGDIQLALPKTAGASMRLEATEGTVSANLAGFQVTDLSVAGDLLRGVLNGGGGQVEAQTRAGDIVFSGI